MGPLVLSISDMGVNPAQNRAKKVALAFIHFGFRKLNEQLGENGHHSYLQINKIKCCFWKNQL